MPHGSENGSFCSNWWCSFTLISRLALCSWPMWCDHIGVSRWQCTRSNNRETAPPTRAPRTLVTAIRHTSQYHLISKVSLILANADRPVKINSPLSLFQAGPASRQCLDQARQDGLSSGMHNSSAWAQKMGQGDHPRPQVTRP